VTQSGEASTEQEPTGGTLGVDLGIVNLATHSEGERFTGRGIPLVRGRSHRRRQRLQRVNTPTSQRGLPHPSRTKLVQHAVVSCKARALDTLSGPPDRIRLRHDQRDQRHSWALCQRRQSIPSQAAQVGAPVSLGNPRAPSRAGAAGGRGEKANRSSQDSFLCQRWGLAAHAEDTAAIHSSKRDWAAGNRPTA